MSLYNLGMGKKIYLTNLVKFMQNVNDNELLLLILENIKNQPKILLSDEILLKKILKIIIELWGTSDELSTKF